MRSERESKPRSQCGELIRGKIALIVFTFVFIQNVPSLSLLVSVSALDPSLARGVWPSHCLHLDHLAPLFPADSSDLYKVQIIFTSPSSEIMKTQRLSWRSWPFSTPGVVSTNADPDYNSGKKSRTLVFNRLFWTSMATKTGWDYLES